MTSDFIVDGNALGFLNLCIFTHFFALKCCVTSCYWQKVVKKDTSNILKSSIAGLEIRNFSNRSSFNLLAGPEEILTCPTPAQPVLELSTKQDKISKIFFFYKIELAFGLQISAILI